MCGIAGIIGSPGADHRSALGHMTAALAHRGPDAGGEYIDPAAGVFLGHRRLSILDLSDRANQPMASDDKRHVIVFNGEVYNFIEIRDELEKAGRKFRTTSDTEVVLQAYAEWGKACFRRFRGMFAIAIYDCANRELVLARDPLGIKPLYYLRSGESLSFASEARVLWQFAPGHEKCARDNEQIAILLAHSYLPDSEKTVVKGIAKLPPGSCLVSKGGSLTVSRYWKLDKDASWDGLTFEDGAERFHSLFRDTTRIMLRSDVPLSFLLSGGLDSSYVLATAKEAGMSDLRTFTAVFGHELDEGEYARKVADHLGARHAEVKVEIGDVAAEFDKIIPFYDDLSSMDSGLFTTAIISRLIARQGVKVAFVGEGSDEIFGGYSWFGLSQLPFSLLPMDCRALGYYYATTRMWSPSYWPNRKRISAAFAGSGDNDIFRQVSACEVNLQLPNHLLQKVDRATMSASLEARVPFMDHEVVTAAYSMPRQWKRGGSWFRFGDVQEKLILRKLAEKKLPPGIAWRKKRGFFLPIADVLLRNRDFVEQTLLAPDSIALEWMPARDIRGAMKFRKTMYHPLEKQKEVLLWRLLLLSLWHRRMWSGNGL